MADAYARTSGEVAVVDPAPGLRADQRADRDRRGREEPHPAAGAGRRDRRAPPCGRTSASTRTPWRARSAPSPERVHSPASAAADVVRAYGTCRDQRRTVVLNLPLDVQAAPADAGARPGADHLARRPAPTRGAVAELAALLDGAQRPVFIAGRGARDARAELEALADRLRRAARDVRGGARALRRPPVVARHLRRLLHAAGRRADHRRRPRRRLGRVADDVDHPARGAARRRDGGAGRRHAPTRSARSARSTSGVLGDVAATARDVAEARRDLRGLPDRRRRGPAGAPTAGTRRPPTSSGSDRIDPRTLSAALDELLPAERTVAVDSGNFMGYPAGYLRRPRRGRLLLHPGLPVDRAGPRHRPRGRPGPSGPPRRRGVRRRRLPHGDRRARDGRAAGARAWSS